MKKLLLGAAVIALTQGAATAQAQSFSDAYVSGKIGITRTSDADFNDTGVTGDIGIDNGVNFAAAIGANVAPSVRAEFEISYRKADFDDITFDGVGTIDATGDLKTWGFMVNGYYDFMAENAFSPYLTAGIGALRHSIDIAAVGYTSDSSDTTFAYQLGFGAGYDVADNITVDGGYRYLGGSDADFDTTSAEYDAHEFRIGLRYGF